MYNVSGPTPVTPLQRSDESNLFLRVNQRVAGEVLNVSNGQVVIAIQGVPIVAKLSSPEQAAMLLERQTAQFVVKELSNQQITLQLLPGQANTATTEQVGILNSQTLAANLLNELGINPTPENLLLAEAAIQKGLAVDNQLLNVLRQALSGTNNWGIEDAKLATSLAASGLPVSEATIDLARNAPYQVNSDLSSLMQQMEAAANRSAIPSQLREIINRVAVTLQDAVISDGASADAIRLNLQKAVALLGRSVENELSGLIRDGVNANLSASEKGLLALNHLQGELQKAGIDDLAQTISRFLDGMRWMHLVNASSDPVLSQWTQMEIPIQMPAAHLQPPNRQNSDMEEAHLRILQDNGCPDQPIDPQNTRLLIQMDLVNNESIQVDLSVVQHRIGALITTSSEGIQKLASEELPGLSDGLEKIGYELKNSQVYVTNTIQPAKIPGIESGITLGAVDLET